MKGCDALVLQLLGFSYFLQPAGLTFRPDQAHTKKFGRVNLKKDPMTILYESTPTRERRVVSNSSIICICYSRSIRFSVCCCSCASISCCCGCRLHLKKHGHPASPITVFDHANGSSFLILAHTWLKF